MEVRDGVPVWGGDAVEATVVPTRSPVSRRFLSHHVEGRRPVALGWSDDAQVEHVLKFGFGDLQALRS